VTGARQQPFLYVIVCASGIAPDVPRLITAAQAEGWDVGVIVTPNALGFVNREAIERQTGHPIRSAWRTPDEVAPLPAADAIAVAPATFNTINKWAAGISDTLALGILCEAHGLGTPIAVQPAVGAALAAHPAYGESLARLRSMGVLFNEHTPGQPHDWARTLDLLRPVLTRDTP
jgi:phosphopantothenoylcysteine synthetase/decarboxylase